jgi:hypothetical protein
VAFGDDAGVAAGAVSWKADGQPLFCGDAVADPLTGLHAVVAALAFWQRGERALLDINLCDVTAHCRAFYTSTSPGVVCRDELTQEWRLAAAGKTFDVQQPGARRPLATAAMSGANSRRVFMEYGISC